MGIKKSRIQNVDARYKNVKKVVNSVSSKKENKEFIQVLNILKTR